MHVKNMCFTVYRQFAAVKCFFLRRFVAESILHLTLPHPKKTSNPHKSHDPTRPGQGGHVPTCGYATASAIIYYSVYFRLYEIVRL